MEKALSKVLFVAGFGLVVGVVMALEGGVITPSMAAISGTFSAIIALMNMKETGWFYE